MSTATDDGVTAIVKDEYRDPPPPAATGHRHPHHGGGGSSGAAAAAAETDSSTNSSTAGGGGSSSAASGCQNEGVTRQNNLQRIQLRKDKMYGLPKNIKMAKLAGYSACQVDGCRCLNWKTPEENRQRDAESHCPQFSELCRTCKHSMGKFLA